MIIVLWGLVICCRLLLLPLFPGALFPPDCCAGLPHFHAMGGRCSADGPTGGPPSSAWSCSCINLNRTHSCAAMLTLVQMQRWWVNWPGKTTIKHLALQLQAMEQLRAQRQQQQQQ